VLTPPSTANGTATVNCLMEWTRDQRIVPYGFYNLRYYNVFAEKSVSPPGDFIVPLVTSPFVDPQFLFERYKIPYGISAHKGSQSVVEFGGQYYSQKDLEYFLGNFSISNASVSVVGPNNQSLPGDEASLDIQWMLAVAPGVPLTFWSIGKLYLLEWAHDLLNQKSPPLVNSISYGGNEMDSPAEYQSRVDTEFKKLGLLGITIMVSSGDAGATNIGHGSQSCTPFQPQFPTSLTTVLSVSATYFTPNAYAYCYNKYANDYVGCPPQAIAETAVAANNGMSWTTGGGFSNLVPRPSWQNKAVQQYLNTPGVLPPASMFNASGRAYPDVSANGHNLLVMIAGIPDIADGTSASSPIFAAIVSLLNDYVLSFKGQKPLGPIGPLLYQIAEEYPEAFYDVTYGNNYCGDVLHPPYSKCCPNGYSTSIGWDAVTGLGSPRFPALLAAVAKTLKIPPPQTKN